MAVPAAAVEDPAPSSKDNVTTIVDATGPTGEPEKEFISVHAPSATSELPTPMINPSTPTLQTAPTLRPPIEPFNNEPSDYNHADPSCLSANTGESFDSANLDASTNNTTTRPTEGQVQSVSGKSPLSAIPPFLRPKISPRQATEDFDPSTHDELYKSISDPLKQGTMMLKISAKKTARRLVTLKPEAGMLLWESKHAGMLNIENIRELRFASDARGFRVQFKVPAEMESRWITIIYTSSGKYKILHLVALSNETFRLWKDTLTMLFDQRKELLGGLDQSRKRQSIFLKQQWSNADINGDHKLDYRDVTMLCRNLNITASEKDLRANFARADVRKRGYLDFSDFQVFVKYLRRRPEVEAIMRTVAGSTEYMPVENFKCFMRNTQRTKLPAATVEAIYYKFSDTTATAAATVTAATTETPSNSTDNADATAQSALQQKGNHALEGYKGKIMTIEGFTSFLHSSDNMAFDEEQLHICDDMTKPLCEYYISSSHNTYLVGGQLKGESTAEGYIRALQQGCRSVELDIWDGPDEPVVYHGRTLTSRLPVREALTAIAKYAFIASPYPLIMSMEVHCDHAQQDKLAEILRATLGDSLVDSPMFGEDLEEIYKHANHSALTVSTTIVDNLPSPEELKYKILVKAKNLYVVKAAAKAGETLSMDSEESSSTSSDSDLKKVFTSAMRIIRPNPGPSPPAPSPSISPPASAHATAFNFTGTSPAKSASKDNTYPGNGSSTVTPIPIAQNANSSAPTERQQVTNAISPDYASGLSLSATSSQSSKESKRLSLGRIRSRSEVSTTGTSSGSGGSSKDKPLMSFHLAALIVYTVGVKWRGLNKKEQYAASHVISLGERRANKIIKESKNDLIAHNRTHLIRTYPAGTRFTSSNYLPYYFWAVGCSMVSINFQTFDLGNEINSAFFKKNGRSGYILKPDILRLKGDEKDKTTLAKSQRYLLMVEILSAQQLPNPKGTIVEQEGEVNLSQDNKTLVVKDKDAKQIPVNPYVEVTIHTPANTTGDIPKFKTSIIWGNGFNPVFSDSGKFQIPFTVPYNDASMLELCFVRFEVMVRIGNDDLSLGKYCVSLPCLLPGYRHVPLYDHLGQQYLFSSLFVYTQLKKQ